MGRGDGAGGGAAGVRLRRWLRPGLAYRRGLMQKVFYLVDEKRKSASYSSRIFWSVMVRAAIILLRLGLDLGEDVRGASFRAAATMALPSAMEVSASARASAMTENASCRDLSTISSASVRVLLIILSLRLWAMTMVILSACSASSSRATSASILVIRLRPASTSVRKPQHLGR